MSATTLQTFKGPYHHHCFDRIKSAIDTCLNSVSKINNRAEKGRVREIVLSNLFVPLLPKDVGIGTGLIVGANNAQSNQLDVIFYDRSILPPILFNESHGLFPIESVVYVIEIKSQLNIGELKTSHESARKLASIGIHVKAGQVSLTGPRPNMSIFALSSNLKREGKSELDRYDEVRGTDPPYLSCICVAGKGYWFYEGPNLQHGQWVERYQYAEVVGYMAGILNEIQLLLMTRRLGAPFLGSYLVDFGKDMDYFNKELDKLASQIAKEKPSIEVIKAVRMALEALRSSFQENLNGYQPNHQHTLCLKSMFEQRIQHIEQRLDSLQTSVCP
jgi:hypothetical protein